MDKTNSIRAFKKKAASAGLLLVESCSIFKAVYDVEMVAFVYSNDKTVSLRPEKTD